MIRLRRYPTQIEAERAATFLTDHGIPVKVVGDHVATAMGISAMRMLHIDLVLLDESRRDEAEGLLREYESEPIHLDPDWEEQALADIPQETIDRFPLRCPECGYDVRGLPRRAACPECGAELDLIELIASQHGPEALMRGEPAAEPAAHVPGAGRSGPRCRDCGRDLTGLPARGRCPDCGRLFDKDQGRGRRFA